MSPISSRKSVPRCACSNFPMCRAAAPVNEPFSWPNSSDSISSAGTAAQLSETKGADCRGLFSCSVRAISSLPVPVSPRMQTRVSLAATCSTCAITSRIAGLAQTMWCLPRRAFRSRFSCSRRVRRIVFSTVSNSFSVEIGFSRKSTAPSRVARTAISIVAWPDIITAGDVTPIFLRSSSKRDAVPAGHHHVGENQVEALGLRDLQCARGVVANGRLVAGQAKSAGERRERVRIVVDDQDMGFERHGFSPSLAGLVVSTARCAAQAASGPATAVAKSVHDAAMRLDRQSDVERCSYARLALDRNSPAMIADHRLHDREAEAGAVLLGGVVRSEEPLAFFRRQPAYRYRKFRCATPSSLVRRAQHQHAARRHGIHRVQHQIFDRPMQQRRVGLNHRQILFQMKFGRDRRTPHRAELRFEKLHDAANHVVQVHRSQFRLRHFCEIAEAADDLLQILDFRKQYARSTRGTLPQTVRDLLFCALEVLDRGLQRKKRILQLVRQPPRQFPPGRHALGLHQSFALLAQLRRSCD